MSAGQGRRFRPGVSADDPDVLRLGPLLALRDVELDLLPFLKAAVAAPCDRAEVHKHVRAALDRDETVALVTVEPLHRSLRHLDLLRPGCGAPPQRRGARPANSALASLSPNARRVCTGPPSRRAGRGRSCE